MYTTLSTVCQQCVEKLAEIGCQTKRVILVPAHKGVCSEAEGDVKLFSVTITWFKIL